MKFNLDCARRILLEVEKMALNDCMTLDSLSSKIPDFPEEEIYYNCLKLDEGDYLDITTLPILGQLSPAIRSINDITFQGHQFLESIRNDQIWEKTKKIASKLDVCTLSSVQQIATKIISDSIDDLI